MARPVSRTRAHAVVQPLIPTNRALTRALRRSLQHKIFFVPVNRFTQTTYRPTPSATPKIPPTRHVPWNQAAPPPEAAPPSGTFLSRFSHQCPSNSLIINRHISPSGQELWASQPASLCQPTGNRLSPPHPCYPIAQDDKETIMSTSSRRTFLAASAAFSLGGVLGANDKINIGIVGIGGRGNDHIRSYATLPGARIVALCDVNQTALETGQAAAKKLTGEQPKGYDDMRKLFADKEVDAVSVTTPDRKSTRLNSSHR